MCMHAYARLLYTYMSVVQNNKFVIMIFSFLEEKGPLLQATARKHSFPKPILYISYIRGLFIFYSM
jgi:hypothetical protein